MKKSNEKRKRNTYSDEFKSQIVQLYHNGKSKKDILAEYGMCLSNLNTWIHRAETTGSFKEKDNRTDEENELIALRKRNKELKMEVDILKQAALIMGRK